MLEKIDLPAPCRLSAQRRRLRPEERAHAIQQEGQDDEQRQQLVSKQLRLGLADILIDAVVRHYGYLEREAADRARRRTIPPTRCVASAAVQCRGAHTHGHRRHVGRVQATGPPAVLVVRQPGQGV